MNNKTFEFEGQNYGEDDFIVFESASKNYTIEWHGRNKISFIEVNKNSINIPNQNDFNAIVDLVSYWKLTVTNASHYNQAEQSNISMKSKTTVEPIYIATLSTLLCAFSTGEAFNCKYFDPSTNQLAEVGFGCIKSISYTDKPNQVSVVFYELQDKPITFQLV